LMKPFSTEPSQLRRDEGKGMFSRDTWQVAIAETRVTNGGCLNKEY
jgi:hypothetical protein